MSLPANSQPNPLPAPHLLSIHKVPASYALTKKVTPIPRITSSLFSQNTGWRGALRVPNVQTLKRANVPTFRLSPLESVLTKNQPASPLDSVLTKNHPGWVLAPDVQTCRRSDVQTIFSYPPRPVLPPYPPDVQTCRRSDVQTVFSYPVRPVLPYPPAVQTRRRSDVHTVFS